MSASRAARAARVAVAVWAARAAAVAAKAAGVRGRVGVTGRPGRLGVAAPRVGTAAGAAILVAVVWWLGGGPVLDGLRGIDGATLLGALGLGLFTTVLSAWRWCLVARALGVRLPLGRAVADYYRALFLNAALPGGVLGDVHRAVRHGRSAGDMGRGVRAVVVERVAGQVVLVAVGVALLFTHPSPVLVEAGHAVRGAVAGTAVVCGLVAAAVVRARLRRKPVTGAGGLGQLAPGGWAGVLVASVAVLAGYLAMFLLAARAAGSTAPAGELLPLMVLALLAMALPLNVGGWGPREGVTAWAFGAAGLGAAQGLTVAVVYGLLCLAASLPGAVVLLARSVTGMRRRPQVEFEQGVLAEHGAPHRRAERVTHQVRAGEGESGDAVAEQDRCHGDVQPVQRALVEEARHGDAAALHEYAAKAPARELPDHVARGERRAVGQGQYVHAVRAPGGRPPGRVSGGHGPQGGRLAVGEHPVPARYAAARVEDDAHRVVAGAGAHGQPGVVRDGGAGPDDDRVGEGAQAVQVLAVLLTGDVVRVAGAARDETVQALAELRERDVRSGQAQGQVPVGQGVRLGGAVPPPRPAVRTADQSGVVGVRDGPDAAQPLPRPGRVDRENDAGHRTPRREPGDSRERYAPKQSTRAVSNSLPFSADAFEGRPITPDSV